jgi:hypothetical protein
MTLFLRRLATFFGIATVMFGFFAFVPPIHQDPNYHRFADARTILSVPNFWNVVSNLPFLVIALFGASKLRPLSLEHVTLLMGIAGVGIGSAYYHVRPNEASLFWDRLPMTVVFMSLVALTVGERRSEELGRRVLFPLIATGITSVIVWRISGDLRMYAIVQFGSMLAVLAMLAFYPSRRQSSSAMAWVVLLYTLAKAAELLDHQIATQIATGGHPWKHAIAACAVFAYVWQKRPRPSLHLC